MLLVSVALCVIANIPVEAESEIKIKKPADSSAELDKNGILRIDGSVIEIGECEYQDRRDIITVFIPAGVKRIGKNAFFGCGGISAIYCEAQSRPDGWDAEWNNGCYATVTWNAKDLDEGGASQK